MHIGPLQTLRFLMQHPLTMQHPMPAAARYLRWQLGSRLLPGPVAIEFVNDARLLVRRGMTGATGNLYAGLHDYEDMAFLLHALRSGELFVDVGANVGAYTVLAAKVVGARAIAFEPILAAASALRDNLALNAIEHLVTVRTTCVGASARMVHMTTQHDTTNRVLAASPPSPDTIPVQVERLDDVLAHEEPFLLKVDVEGFDLEVVQGAAAVLARPTLQCVIMEVSAPIGEDARSYEELLATMTSHGFGQFCYAPRERRLEPMRPDHRGANSLFIKNRALIQQRLTEARPFRVLNQII